MEEKNIQNITYGRKHSRKEKKNILLTNFTIGENPQTLLF